MWSRLRSGILKHEVLLIIMCLVVILRLPSLFEPHWYGDEEVYLTIGQSLGQGAQLYKDIHDNKPPLLYFVAWAAHGELFWFKLATSAAALLAIAFFWKVARQNALATAIFAGLTTLPLIEGNIANAEMFFLVFTLWGFSRLINNKNIFWSGVILGLGALFKIPAILDVGVWPLFWLITAEPGWFKKSFWLGLGAAIPLGISIIFYAAQGTLNSYLIAAGIQNIPYLSSWQAVSGFWGTLSGRALTALLLVGLIALGRKKLGERRVWLTLWFVITLFAALLSGRPYPHYLLQLAPALALLLTDKYLRVPALAVLAGTMILFKFNVYPVFGYYHNFLVWAAGKIDTGAYYSHFNPQVNTNYQIAREVMMGSTPKEGLFVWGNEPAIYALSRRPVVGKYTVAYHVFDFRAQAETIAALHHHPPRYIVVITSPALLPGLWQFLSESYILTRTVGNAQIYRHPNITAWNIH